MKNVLDVTMVYCVLFSFLLVLLDGQACLAVNGHEFTTWHTEKLTGRNNNLRNCPIPRLVPSDEKGRFLYANRTRSKKRKCVQDMALGSVCQ